MSSEEISVLECIHELDAGFGDVNSASISWLSVNSLGVDLFTSSLSFSLLGIVFSHSSLEGLSALTLTNVLDSDVDSLGEDSASNLFVDDNTDGMLIDIKNSSSLSVVELVGHALVY